MELIARSRRVVLCCALSGFCALSGCKRAENHSTPAAARTPQAGAAGGSVANSSGSNPGETNAALAQFPIHSSGFSTNLDAGRDPFFPESTRRLPKVAAAPNPNTSTLTSAPAAAPVVVPPSSYLKLTGLWPSKTRPLALINRTPLGPGEQADVTVMVPGQQNKVEKQKITVRCLEVRENSVLIAVEGETEPKELLMSAKL